VNNSYSDTVRIVMSGNSDMELVVKAINEGYIYRYITKPFEIDELKIIIRQSLDHYNLLEERKIMTIQLAEQNEKLKNWNITLEQEVQIKTKELLNEKIKLENAYNELKQIDKLKDDFITLVTHELNTPLTVVNGIIELLNDNVVETEKDRQVLFNAINRSLEALNKIVSDIIFMAAIKAGKIMLEFMTIDIYQYIQYIANQVKEQIEQKALQIECINELNQPLKLKTDTALLERIISNILDNAIKFSNNNGQIKIILTEEFNSASKKTIKISIKDNGVGIPKEKLKRICQRFELAGDMLNHSKGLRIGSGYS